jgi:hypothetical protein
MWTTLVAGLLINTCYITGEIRWANTQTTANLKATCPISISLQGESSCWRPRNGSLRFLFRRNPGVNRSYTAGGNPKLRSGNIRCRCRMDLEAVCDLLD